MTRRQLELLQPARAGPICWTTPPWPASWLLGAVTRRLPADWHARYGYAPVLAETFVEASRFAGTSYRAANWILAGQTQGRGKLDRRHEHALPVKDIYLYPLHRRWRQILNTPPSH